MSGEVTHVTSVPGGTVLWALSWEAMLTAELAWFQQVCLTWARSVVTCEHAAKIKLGRGLQNLSSSPNE
jgi:hypothetical protein